MEDYKCGFLSKLVWIKKIKTLTFVIKQVKVLLNLCPKFSSPLICSEGSKLRT